MSGILRQGASQEWVAFSDKAWQVASCCEN